MESVKIVSIFTLFVFAFTLTIVSFINYVQTERFYKLSEKQKDGHLCKRMYNKNYITQLDRKTLNRGWYITQNLTRANDTIVGLYNTEFYLIPDRCFDFEAIQPKIKQVVADLRENGDRCILRDYLEIIRDHVDLTEWLQADHRKYIWESYWYSIEDKQQL